MDYGGQSNRYDSGSSEGRVHQVRATGPKGDAEGGGGAVVRSGCEGLKLSKNRVMGSVHRHRKEA